MNEAPAKLFGLILDAVETAMSLMTDEASQMERAGMMQHAIAANTIISIAPLCASDCEGCHTTARGVLLLSAAAVKALEQQILTLASAPEHQQAMAEFMRSLRERMGSIGVNPGALSHDDLVALGVIDPTEDQP